MKFIVKHREGHEQGFREKIVGFLESNGAEWTSDASEDADFAIVIGGDGTMFRFNSEFRCPILGVNPGQSIGYYMRACNHDYERKLMLLMTGKKGRDYYVYELLKLETRVNSRKLKATPWNMPIIAPVPIVAATEVGWNRLINIT